VGVIGLLSIRVSKESSSSSGPQWMICGRACGGLECGTVAGGCEPVLDTTGAHVASDTALRARYKLVVFILPVGVWKEFL